MHYHPLVQLHKKKKERKPHTHFLLTFSVTLSLPNPASCIIKWQNRHSMIIIKKNKKTTHHLHHHNNSIIEIFFLFSFASKILHGPSLVWLPVQKTERVPYRAVLSQHYPCIRLQRSWFPFVSWMCLYLIELLTQSAALINGNYR